MILLSVVLIASIIELEIAFNQNRQKLETGLVQAMAIEQSQFERTLLEHAVDKTVRQASQTALLENKSPAEIRSAIAKSLGQLISQTQNRNPSTRFFSGRIPAGQYGLISAFDRKPVSIANLENAISVETIVLANRSLVAKITFTGSQSASQAIAAEIKNPFNTDYFVIPIQYSQVVTP